MEVTADEAMCSSSLEGFGVADLLDEGLRKVWSLLQNVDSQKDLGSSTKELASV